MKPFRLSWNRKMPRSYARLEFDGAVYAVRGCTFSGRAKRFRDGHTSILVGRGQVLRIRNRQAIFD
jgi:hypothetical protein